MTRQQQQQTPERAPADNKTNGPSPKSRLVEYFLIISSQPRENQRTNNNVSDTASTATGNTYEDEIDYELCITSRYPLRDYTDNPLNEESVMPFVGALCGNINSTSNVVYVQDVFQMPKMHHFICTGAKGQYVYGTVLTMFEPEQQNSSPDFNKSISEGSASQEYYVPKCLVLLSQHGYLMEFREFLTNLYRISTIPSNLPLERYIVNFCSEIQRPEPGEYSVQYTPSTFPNPLIFTTPPHNLPLALCPRVITNEFAANPTNTLFRVLGVENIVTVWEALALERQVLLVSSSVSLLAIVGEAFLSLLFPLQWSHVYIPLLPQIATTILSAPVPYFCGVHRDVLPSALMDMSQETIIVDVDYDNLTIGPSTPPLPDLPATRKGKLFSVLREYSARLYGVKSADEGIDGSVNNVTKYDEAFTPPAPPADDVPNNCMQTPVEKTHEAFLRFYASILQNYRNYLIFPSKNTPDYMGFRTKQFILSQKFDFQPFLKQLCGTQQFDTFITKRLYAPSALDVVFFDECITKKLKSKKTSSGMGLFKSKAARKSWICVRDEMRDKRTVVSLEPNDTGLALQTFAHETFPRTLDSNLFGECRVSLNSEAYRQASFRNKGPKASNKKYVESLSKANKTNAQVATFTLFFMAYTAIIGEEKLASEIAFKDVSPEKQAQKDEKKDDIDELEESLKNLEATVAPMRKELKRDFHTIPESPQAPLTPTRKHAAEELRYQARAQLGLGFHILRHLRYTLKNKADALTYQFLLNACGKVGDTSLGSQLITCMHEDGCVVETDMYQTLVAAFSVKNVLGRGEGDGIQLPEWANGATNDMDWNKLRRKNYLEMAMNYATGGKSSLVVPDSGSEVGDDQTVSDLDDSSVSGSPAKKSGIMSRLRSSRQMGEVQLQPRNSERAGMRELGLTFSTDSFPDGREDGSLPEAIMVQVILGENLLEMLYPDITIETDNETCPQCTANLTEDDIRNGWTSDVHDYTTTCHNCNFKFVARFSVTSTSPTFVGSRGPTSPLYCEFLSPWILQKELAKVMDESEDAVSFLRPSWRKDTQHATLWWNMIVAFMGHRLPISFLLQGDFPNSLISPTP